MGPDRAIDAAQCGRLAPRVGVGYRICGDFNYKSSSATQSSTRANDVTTVFKYERNTIRRNGLLKIVVDYRPVDGPERRSVVARHRLGVESGVDGRRGGLGQLLADVVGTLVFDHVGVGVGEDTYEVVDLRRPLLK